MSVKVSTIDRASCNEAYHDISGINIIDGQFCVAVHGDQPYQGSTGSPMVSDGYQVGIVSIGFGPPEYPTIFIDVVHYINWIRTHLDD
ncbi:PREDICTED: trypsin-7-like [Ceratosolen solmsi marchali]|uniref:Trypsin-7-like n=1 Tax=Ceratosolen solmsi marchali TaxID=326594 RepID=A0AAJ6YQ94_9HYME|nr:PREDICTED: trypsin-7-like [Ceratosolen solmsi marchali]